MNDCEEYQGLMMGLMDGELTPDESVTINDHLRRCARCREEYEELRETAGKVAAISFREPQDEELRALWKSPYSRFTRNAGLVLVLVGWATLVSYAAYEFLRQGEFDVSSVAGAAVWTGFAILLFSVVRERLRTYRSDPYREVER